MCSSDLFITDPNIVATVHGGAVVGGLGTVAEGGSLNVS